MFVFNFSTKLVYVFRISCKDLKSMLSQVNYRVPNMRFLREKLPVTSSCLSQTTPPPSHYISLPTSLSIWEAEDLRSFVNGPLPFCFLGLRDEERRRVLQPVRPALSQPHVRCSEKRKCTRFMCSQIVLSQHFHPPAPHLMPCQGNSSSPPSVCSQMALRSIWTS